MPVRRWQAAASRSVAAGEHRRQRFRSDGGGGGGWPGHPGNYGLGVCQRGGRPNTPRARSLLPWNPRHMRKSFDVAVVGGGIVGAACAMSCAAAGLTVAVVEPGPIGGGATAAGMGHIVVMDDSPAQLALTHYSRALWMAMVG